MRISTALRRFASVAAFLALIASCGMPMAPAVGAVHPAEVYVAGSYTDSDRVAHACYWRDGAQTVLDGSAAFSEAAAILAAEGSVYAAGALASGEETRACYWKDGARVDLEADDRSYALWIEASGVAVRAAGWAYAETGTRVMRVWTTGDGGSSIESVDYPLSETEGSFCLSGADVLIAGTAIGPGDHAAYYRKGDGSPVYCDGTGPRIAGIWSDGTDVYVYGDIDYEARCWKNGASIGPKEGSAVTAVAKSGSDLFMAGYSIDVTGPYSSVTEAIYWKNGKAWRLPGEDALPKALQVVGGADVYTAGWSMYRNAQTACYWVNGARIDLPGPEGYSTSTAVALFVAPD